MSTVDELVTRTITRLTGAVGRDRINVLATTVDSDDTTVALTYDADVNTTPGAIIQIGYEQMLVVAVPTTTSLTVIRGFNGTTAVAHANGTVIDIEPRFPRQSVLHALCEEVRALPPEIYGTETVDVTFPADTNTAELPVTGEVWRVLDAWRLEATSDHLLRPSLRLVVDPLHSTYTSGYAVCLADGAVYTQAATVRVTVAHRVDATDIDADTDIQDQLGLVASIEDALVYLAGSSQLLDKEALRYDNTRQGQSRDAAELPADALGTLAKRWREEGMRRLSDERMRAVSEWGWRR